MGDAGTLLRGVAAAPLREAAAGGPRRGTDAASDEGVIGRGECKLARGDRVASLACGRGEDRGAGAEMKGEGVLTNGCGAGDTRPEMGA